MDVLPDGNTIDFDALANMFLIKYKDFILSKFKKTEPVENIKFQNLVRSNQLAEGLFGQTQHLCSIYDNPSWHSVVLETLDLDLIYKNVDHEFTKEGHREGDNGYSDYLVRELLRYFKQEFFKWCNKPDCHHCGQNTSENMTSMGIQGPNGEESKFQCGSVEVYECNQCRNVTRFPRYNDPIKLLQTRQGRCGEWCNLFTLILKSFGLEVRYVWNREDHVWCEYFSPYLKRWVHVDSCEQAFDQPYIYSVNWNKKMSYCIAFSKDGVVDVSKRYILQNELPRDQIKEEELSFLCKFITKRLRFTLNDEEIYQLACRDEQEQIELITGKANETETEKKAEGSKTSNPGRESGSAVWKAQRGEDGK
ncbi:peptide-N4-(N-acetyl-beta- glucosaminyl)asparagine amidase [Saccharomyces pastorianus]|uniref:Peptide-N(4)-(N-acetyl-beta-glucosaminyl)asparagine amidase n=1 Tax=Saccharomyces pastorianus TaxID=27292 RepID=A0A6C1EI82_SACPS|nr:peptide-N4-(N-acetyl-beta- glucosaminyl)asparagine amidase [Saccharomyces pastorianus]